MRVSTTKSVKRKLDNSDTLFDFAAKKKRLEDNIPSNFEQFESAQEETTLNSLSGYDKDWYRLGGFPDYRPFSMQMCYPLSKMKRKGISPEKLRSILTPVENANKRKPDEDAAARKKVKLSDLEALENTLEEEKKKSREFEKMLRQKLQGNLAT